MVIVNGPIEHLFCFFKKIYILYSFILFNYLSFRGNTCDNHKSLSSAKMTKILSFESRNDSNTYFLDQINPNLSSEYQKCSSSILSHLSNGVDLCALISLCLPLILSPYSSRLAFYITYIYNVCLSVFLYVAFVHD